MPQRLLPLVALCLALASCNTPAETAGVPAPISYRVTGNDLGFAYASAAQWCGPYGASPVLQSLGPYNPQPVPGGAVAERTVVYNCSGPPAISTAGLHAEPVPGVGSSVPPPPPAPGR